MPGKPMDDLLKPDDEMLFSLATELGLMSIVSVADENDEQKPDGKTPTAAQKVAQLT